MNHLATIQSDFLRYAVSKGDLKTRLQDWVQKTFDPPRQSEISWWKSLSSEKKKRYLQQHPQSKLRFAVVLGLLKTA